MPTSSASGLAGDFSQGPPLAGWSGWYEQRSLELTAIVLGLGEVFSLLGLEGKGGEIEEEVRVKGEQEGGGEEGCRKRARNESSIYQGVSRFLLTPAPHPCMHTLIQGKLFLLS